MIGAALAWATNNVRAIVLTTAAVAAATVIGLGFRHYTGLIKTVSTLQTDNETLKLVVKSQNAAVDYLEGTVERYDAAFAEFEDTVAALKASDRAAGAELRRIQEIFADHDIGELAREKPGLLENRLNDGTARSNRLFECAGGAEHPDCAGGDEGAARAGEAPGP